MPKQRSPWREELNDLMRGLSGAFLFGAPFLYTMEVWWKGNFTSPLRMLIALGLSYLSLLGLNLAAGFRSEKETSWPGLFADSAEALVIALVAAAGSLVLIGVIEFDEGLDAIMGRIIMETVPFSIGVGIANNFLKPNDEREGAGKGGDSNSRQWRDHSWHGTMADAGATALGAIVIAFSIAPTDEIPMIASGLSSPALLGLMAASLLLSYIIVFEAEFGSQSARASQPGILQSPVSETFASYLISLAMSLGMLWLFQIVRPGDPLSQWVTYAIVLGFPATIGGAAGRLVI